MTNKELKDLAMEIDNLAFEMDRALCSILESLEKLNNRSETLLDEAINRDLEEARTTEQ